MQYKLKTPFKFGNETVTEVTLKDAFNAGDMIRIANEEKAGDSIGATLCAMTGWPLPKVAQMGIDDAMAIADVAAPFLDRSKKTGSET